MNNIVNTLSAILAIIIFALLYVVSIENKRYIFTKIIRRAINNSREKKVDFYISGYKQHFLRDKSSSIGAVVVPLIPMLIVAIILYKFVFFAVPVSNSMLPTFTQGDLVLYQTYNITPNVGDIILFEVLGKDAPVTHRVYSIDHSFNKTFLLTKGDNGGVDPWKLYPSNIYAKAVMVADKPIVLKYIGSYLTGELHSGVENTAFKVISAVFQKGRELGLLIFSTCIILYLLTGAYDISSHKRHKRR